MTPEPGSEAAPHGLWSAPGGASLLTLVINLERSTQRLQAMSHRLQALGLPWRRLPAVDGRELAGRWPAGEVDEPGYRRWHGRPLPAPEVGVYLSHLQALRTFLDSPATHALVLEDDALPEPGCRQAIEALLAQPDAWDLAKLSGFHGGTPVGRRPLGAGFSLAVPLTQQMNAAAVVFSRDAARAVLGALVPMRLPYDHALERPWTYGSRLRIVVPSPFGAQDGSPSTISGGRTQKFGGWQRLPTHAFRVRNESRRLAWALGQWLRR